MATDEAGPPNPPRHAAVPGSPSPLENYAKMPTREECVFPLVLQRMAAKQPDKPFIVELGGSLTTYAEFYTQMLRTAAGLARLGVQRGDTVLCWLPNGLDILRAWFGANQLGAIYVPINTAYRGRLLEHVIADSGAKVLITVTALVERLHDVEIGELTDIVLLDGETPCPVQLGVHGREAFVLEDGEGTVPACPSEPWEPQAIIYTSGTTGPSKGVLSSYAHLWASTYAFAARTTCDDRMLANIPLFHVGGTSVVVAMLINGASMALMESFATGTFWKVVRETQSTACMLVGAMVTFLVKQPPNADDADNPLREAWLSPYNEEGRQFAERFGCRPHAAYNSTEVSVPVHSGETAVLGTIGGPRTGVEVRIVDEHDLPVPWGEVGELIVHTAAPWTMNSGYWRRPEATAEAWRNGWFHTGDAFRIDENGNYVFVDRLKDAIRRRGENISSFEVESEIGQIPGVREVAAIGVPGPGGESEVMAVIAPSGDSFDPTAAIEMLSRRLPHFMIPRYIRMMAELPKTPTGKVRKHLLRDDGITSDTWDREASGLVFKRERITARPVRSEPGSIEGAE
jgi:carnitine-CoA ligase